MAWFRCGEPSGSNIDQIATIALNQEFDYAELDSNSDKIPQYVFYGSKIRDVISADVVTVGAHAFDSCNYLRQIYLPNCETVEAQAFTCSRTTYANSVSIYLPKCKSIGSSAFQDFRGVDTSAELEFPLCESVGSSAFAGTSANQLTVKSMDFSSVKAVGGSAFQRVIADTIIIGSACYTMNSTPFAYASVGDLIILAASPPTLATSAGLGSNAVITNIYVPDASVTTYQQANRWSNYSSIIKPYSQYSPT